MKSSKSSCNCEKQHEHFGFHNPRTRRGVAGIHNAWDDPTVVLLEVQLQVGPLCPLPREGARNADTRGGGGGGGFVSGRLVSRAAETFHTASRCKEDSSGFGSVRVGRKKRFPGEGGGCSVVAFSDSSSPARVMRWTVREPLRSPFEGVSRSSEDSSMSLADGNNSAGTTTEVGETNEGDDESSGELVEGRPSGNVSAAASSLQYWSEDKKTTPAVSTAGLEEDEDASRQEWKIQVEVTLATIMMKVNDDQLVAS